MDVDTLNKYYRKTEVVRPVRHKNSNPALFVNTPGVKEVWIYRPIKQEPVVMVKETETRKVRTRMNSAEKENK